MKKNIFSLMLFLLSVQFAQAQKYNPDLLKSYSKAELELFSSEDLKAIEYGISNAVYYIQIPTGKNLDLQEIENSNWSTNFTDYKFKIADLNQYYRIKNTDKMLVVKSINVLKNELLNKIK